MRGAATPHKFDPSHVGELDRPDRGQWQPVGTFLDLLRPHAGGTYADVGCGAGYFAIPVAERIRPDEKVYGLDVQPEMLEELRRRVHARGLTNVVPLLSREQKLPLPTAGIDDAWSVNTFHEFDAPLALLYEIARILRPGGKVWLVDWKPIETPMGPPLEERVPVERIVEALKAAGFTKIREHAVYAYHNVVEGSRPGGKR